MICKDRRSNKVRPKSTQTCVEVHRVSPTDKQPSRLHGLIKGERMKMKPKNITVTQQSYEIVKAEINIPLSKTSLKKAIRGEK